MVNIKGTVGRLDYMENNGGELEEGMRNNEDDISDLQSDSKNIENDEYQLKKQLMYIETLYTLDRKTLTFLACQKIPTRHTAAMIWKKDHLTTTVDRKTAEKLFTNFWRNA